MRRRLPVCQVTVRNKPASSQTPIAVPSNTLSCLQGYLSVYLYTPLLPVSSYSCCALTPADLSLVGLRIRVPGFAPGPLAAVPQSSGKLLGVVHLKFHRCGRGKTTRHSKALPPPRSRRL